MESEVPAERSGSMVGGFLTPVSPYAYGEGLPYAPIDWPKPGDIWKWKVGSRISKSGYYHDRFLYPPSSFLKRGIKRKYFASKPSLEQYIRTEFPGADVNAFFDSFSLRIPSKMHSWTRSTVDCAKAGKEIRVDGEMGKSPRKQNGKEKSPRKRNQRPAVKEEREKEKTPRKRKQTPAELSPIQEREKEKTPRKRKQTPAELSPIRKLHTRQSWKRFLSSRPKHTSPLIDLEMEETSSSDLISHDQQSNSESRIYKLNEESPAEVTGEDFDEYCKSLEDILIQPPATIAPTPEELDGARMKLSSLLSMDFPSLMSSDHLPELSALCWTLRKDPSLSADQVSMLRLIEEIPMTSTAFLEAREIIEQADEFLANFEAKLAEATLLRNEYNVSKEKESAFKAEVSFDSLAIKDIDNQISQLQSRRAEILVSIENKKKQVDELVAVQKRATETLPAVVLEFHAPSLEEFQCFCGSNYYCCVICQKK